MRYYQLSYAGMKRGDVLSSQGKPPTTIGAKKLNFCVRHWKVTKMMLQNMVDKSDFLLTFSDILSGQLFFIPSRDMLDKIADGELNK